jgi:hypothetical protein
MTVPTTKTSMVRKGEKEIAISTPVRKTGSEKATIDAIMATLIQLTVCSSGTGSVGNSVDSTFMTMRSNVKFRAYYRKRKTK